MNARSQLAPTELNCGSRTDFALRTQRPVVSLQCLQAISTKWDRDADELDYARDQLTLRVTGSICSGQFSSCAANTP